MPVGFKAVPIYRRHKSTNQAVCTVRLPSRKRKDIYLGRWNTAASKAEFSRIVSIVAANGGFYPDDTQDLSIYEGIARYGQFVDSYYRNPDGSPAMSGEKIKHVLGYLTELFGPTPLAEFGPPELKAIRNVLIEKGIVRKQINKYAGVIRQFFRWCVEEGLVGSSVLESLRAVRPLAIGRSGAVEGTPRQPADPKAVEAALPFMSPAVRTVVQILRHTGARPTEILSLRPCDLDRSGEIWKYIPETHKTSWKGKARTIYFGPEAKAALIPWLLGVGPEEWIFSPKRSEEMRSRERSEQRKTPKYPSHMARNERKRKAKRSLPPTDRYGHEELARGVARACKRAGVKAFSPYCLRHLKAVELRGKYGLEVVRAVLGQSSMAIAEHYSKAADEVLATKAASEAG